MFCKLCFEFAFIYFQDFFLQQLDALFNGSRGVILIYFCGKFEVGLFLYLGVPDFFEQWVFKAFCCRCTVVRVELKEAFD